MWRNGAHRSESVPRGLHTAEHKTREGRNTTDDREGFPTKNKPKESIATTLSTQGGRVAEEKWGAGFRS